MLTTITVLISEINNKMQAFQLLKDNSLNLKKIS
jgi:hypothetical protein